MTSEFKVEANLGNNISAYSGLDVVEAEGAIELASLLKQIKFPFNIVQICVKGTRFYAFINSSRPIKKKVVKP